jgi:NADPH-dependent glutamate synthase beta subunit-like oxidoreductase/ferredoxin
MNLQKVFPVLATGNESDHLVGDLPGLDQAWLQANIPCQYTCPAHTDVSGYIELLAQGRFKEAYLLNRRDNVFPGVLGRICARPCEASCRRQVVDQPVAICSLKRSSSDFRVDALLPPRPAITRSERVAVVGAGPAGLTCARDLRELGYAVTVYDAMPEPGGMLVGGIPAWRLPREVVKDEVNRYMAALGVEFRLNTKVGQDVALTDLLREYAAVFLAAGRQQPVKLNIPGQELAGFEYGLPWLKKLNLQAARVDLTGKRVVVLGAGFTALDCARSAVRLGAQEVYLCYRRTQLEAALDEVEMAQAEQEGVKFAFLLSPLEALGDDEGRVKGLKLIRNRMSEPDGQGHRSPLSLPGSELVVDCELVIAATGQQSDLSWLPPELKAVAEREGGLRIDPAWWSTGVAGLFAGGDFTQGSRNVISAVADGHKVAHSIHTYLSKEQPPAAIASLEPVRFKPRDLHYLSLDRQSMPCLLPGERMPAGGRGLKKEVELGYNIQQARGEAERCLRCMYNITLDAEACIMCGACVEICPEKAIQAVPLRKLVVISDRNPEEQVSGNPLTLNLNESLCVRCGQCVDECPTEAINLNRFRYNNPALHWYVGQAVILPTTEPPRKHSQLPPRSK